MKILFCWIFVFCYLYFGEGLKTSKTMLSTADDPNEVEWHRFKNTHNKQYKSLLEEGDRKKHFLASLDKINKHNAEFKAGRKSFSMGINSFADIPFAEFQQKKLGHKMEAGQNVPESFNLKNQLKGELTNASVRAAASNYPDNAFCNYITPVKNQGDCGCCWAFAATATLETAYSILTNTKTADFSEQQILDCVSKDKDCIPGGRAVNAFATLLNGANTKEYMYPYIARKNPQCLRNIQKEGYVVYDYKYRQVPYGSPSLENEMLQALFDSCAFSINLGVYSDSFRFYRGGIYSGDYDCSLPQNYPNHEVTVVGYGIQNGVKYWLVKNSWGTGWGESGFFRIKRGENVCKSENYFTYPKVKMAY